MLNYFLQDNPLTPRTDDSGAVPLQVVALSHCRQWRCQTASSGAVKLTV